jgi:hypothetical protein
MSPHVGIGAWGLTLARADPSGPYNVSDSPLPAWPPYLYDLTDPYPNPENPLP